MNLRFRTILVLLLLFSALSFSILGVTSALGQVPPPPSMPELEPVVQEPFRQDEISQLREAPPSSSLQPEQGLTPPTPRPRGIKPAAVDAPFTFDPALQQGAAPAAMPLPIMNFEGVGNVNGVVPADPIGDIGMTHYVQWVNLSMAIWKLDRTNGTMTLVYGPTAGNQVWAGFGGACETSNDGDPMVLYDHLANRWLISQFALPNYPSGPFFECIAVSQSEDPTAGWYRYAYEWTDGSGMRLMNDYPKMGVWNDGYYMSTNQFAEGSEAWRGAGVAAFERDKMLQGLTARMVYFNLYPISQNYGSLLPADLDGKAPPLGTPNYFAEVDDATVLGPSDAIRIWEFAVNWSNPAASTFGLMGKENWMLPTAAFTPLCSKTQFCIQQPGTNQRLDAIGERLMNRLQFRSFEGYNSLVTNQTVDVGGGRAGIRWYELRNSGSGWQIYQQGTFAGDETDTENRWMGSAAMDSAGNLAVGYSVSSPTVYPSIRYAGRRAGDPAGTLAQGEVTLVQGTGSQTSPYARWGDYSMLSVDPLDECTFWYTNEYIAQTSDRNWRTRIGSFIFDGCRESQKGNLRGKVTEQGSGLPIAKAQVSAGSYSTLTDAEGNYDLSGLPVGVYTLTVSAYAYLPPEPVTVQVRFNQTEQNDFSLIPLPRTVVHGTVQDGSGQGWPLYARIEVNSQNLAEAIYTHPETGAYTIELGVNISHTFTILPVVPGYVSASRVISVTQENPVEDFSLLAASQPPCAPGYTGTPCTPQSGGLIYGHVLDANFLTGVNDASVASLEVPGDATRTLATPDDPAVDDGFYLLFSSLSGNRPFRATKLDYGLDQQAVEVFQGQIVRQDFTLPAPQLSLVPEAITATIPYSQAITRTLTIRNIGTLTATFAVSEVNALLPEPPTSGPFAPLTRHVSFKRFDDLNGAALNNYQPPQAERLPGGKIVQSWPSNLMHPWGIGLDLSQGTVWVGDVAVGGGEDSLTGYALDGTPSLGKIERSDSSSVFFADLAYQPFSGTLWQVEVAGGNCWIELDSLQQRATGRKICPAPDNPQRGLAFNPLDRTFFSGSWIDGTLNHFSSEGHLLDSAATGLNISGLAFNPSTQHLFVLSSAETGYDVYVLEGKWPYTILGGFDIEGLGAYEQAGLELDCSGNLWTVNQISGQVYQVESGETSACAWAEVPWLTLQPTHGSLPPGESLTLSFKMQSTLTQERTNRAQVVLQDNSPYDVLSIPVTLTVMIYDFETGSQALVAQGLPGKQILYSVPITNTGDLTDTLGVSLAASRWKVEAPSSIGPLLPGQVVTLPVTVTIPPHPAPLMTDTVTLTLTSRGNPSIQRQLRLDSHTRFKAWLPFIRFLRYSPFYRN